MSRLSAKTSWILVVAGLVWACGTGGDGGDGDGDGDGDGVGGEVYSLTWGPFDVAPGEEDTKCVIKKLDNTTEIKVGEFHNVLGATSHHFIVYRVADNPPERPEPFDCDPFIDIVGGAPVMITQKSDDTLILPDGVAYSLEANQTIRLEMHYLNATDDVQTLSATAEFTTIADSDFEHEADFIFIGDVDISIDAMATLTVGPTFVSPPPEFDGVNYFGITGHTHQWGTDVTVDSANAAGESMAAIYDVPQFKWDEPDTIMHSPPIQLPPGGGFNFSCDYNNQSTSSVSFGDGVDDEMCFFWAYYYPSKGARVCAQTDQLNNYFCCPGGPSLICDNLLQ